MIACEECEILLPCVGMNGIDKCKECDEQFKYCYYECENPCRTKKEQKLIFDKVKPGWDDPQ